jgi:hypothetical protein
MLAKTLMCVVAFSVAAATACARPSPHGPDVYGYRVKSASADPVVIERAPRVYFRGAFAHLHGGEWYYRTETGWVVFVEAPPELERSRDSVETEQSATELPSPRGPTINQQPGAGGPLALPPPKVQ